MSKMKSRVLAGVFVCAPLLAGMQTASAQLIDPQPVLPGGTLDPTLIPKFVDDLVIPPVLYDDRTKRKGMKIQVSQRQIKQQVLPTTGCLERLRPGTNAYWLRWRCFS